MWSHLLLGLDATYTLDDEPTGVAVYSNEILNGLACLGIAERIRAYYRPHRFLRALRAELPGVVSRRILFDGIAPRTKIFHGLNQRLPRAKRGRFVVTFHDLFVMTAEYSTPEFRARFTQLSRDAAARADIIIAVSAFTASQIRDHLHVDESRIRVVHHGVHAASRSPRSDRLILHVGAIQERKNLVRLIEAFEQTPPGWQLVLAGGCGYGADRVLGRVERSRRRADINLPGYVDKATLETLYARAAIFAFPSLDEGFGMPILDAMARCIPVLTSKGSATEEVAGSAALLVDPSQTESLIHGLLQLTSDESLRNEYGEKGFARSQHFSWDRAVQATAEIYRELA